jgi:hypothetical protein
MRNIVCLILIFIAFPAFGDCCYGPACRDGTTNPWNCGAGKSRVFWPNGCFFLTSCGCPVCREAKSLDECLAYCKHKEVYEESVCYGSPWATSICVNKALRDQDDCDSDCERRF